MRLAEADHHVHQRLRRSDRAKRPISVPSARRPPCCRAPPSSRTSSPTCGTSWIYRGEDHQVPAAVGRTRIRARHDRRRLRTRPTAPPPRSLTGAAFAALAGFGLRPRQGRGARPSSATPRRTGGPSTAVQAQAPSTPGDEPPAALTAIGLDEPRGPRRARRTPRTFRQAPRRSRDQVLRIRAQLIVTVPRTVRRWANVWEVAFGSNGLLVIVRLPPTSVSLVSR